MHGVYVCKELLKYGISILPGNSTFEQRWPNMQSHHIVKDMTFKPRWHFHVWVEQWLIETAGGKINDIDAGWKATFDGSLSLLVKTPLNLIQHRIDVNHIFLWDSRTSSNSWHLVNRNNGSCYLKLSWRILRIALGVKHTTSKCELFIEFFSRCRWQLIGSLVNEISTIESILFLNLFIIQSRNRLKWKYISMM